MQPRLPFRQKLMLLHLVVFTTISLVVLATVLLLRVDLVRQHVGVLLVAFTVTAVASALSTWLLAGRVVAPLRDISEAAQALSPSNIGERIDVLEEATTTDEVARLQQELNDALARLEEGFRAQEQFVANVAHDLKTPIAVLLTEAQTLLARTTTRAEHESFANSVQDEMRRLGRLVESFLTLKRVEQGHPLVRLAPVHIHDVILDAIAHGTPPAKQHGARLVATLAEAEDAQDLVIPGDADLLRTMLDNLIRNALRFSPAGGTIDVRVDPEPGHALISVLDRGPGIPADELEHVFERFARGSSARDRAGGTGLGLAIARSVAELHHGDISVANRPGGGCMFSIRLPRMSENPT